MSYYEQWKSYRNEDEERKKKSYYEQWKESRGEEVKPSQVAQEKQEEKKKGLFSRFKENVGYFVKGVKETISGEYKKKEEDKEKISGKTSEVEESLSIVGEKKSLFKPESFKQENIIINETGDVSSPRLEAIKKVAEDSIADNILMAQEERMKISQERDAINKEIFSIMEKHGVKTNSEYVASIYSYLSSNNPLLPIPNINKLFMGKEKKEDLKRIEELIKAKRELDLADNLYEDVADKELYDNSFFQPFKDQFKKAAKMVDLPEAERLLPFVKGIDELAEEYTAYKAIQKQKRNERLSPYEEALLKKRTAKGIKEMSLEKPFGAAIAEGLMQMPTYGIEFYLTGGLYTGVKAAVTGSRLMSKVPALVAKSIGVLSGTAVQTGVGFAPTVMAKSAEFAFTDNIKLIKKDDGGYTWEMLDENSSFEKELLEKLPKGYLHTFVEVAGERSGELIDYLKTGVLAKYLSKKGMTLATKTPTAFQNILKKSGWNGILTEILEEEVTELGQFKLEDRKYAPVWTEEGAKRLIQEAITVGMYGTLINITNGVVSKDNPINKEGLKELQNVEKKINEVMQNPAETTQEITQELVDKYKSNSLTPEESKQFMASPEVKQALDKSIAALPEKSKKVVIKQIEEATKKGDIRGIVSQFVEANLSPETKSKLETATVEADKTKEVKSAKRIETEAKVLDKVYSLDKELQVFRGTTTKGQELVFDKDNGITGGESTSISKEVAQRFSDMRGGEVQQYVLNPTARVIDHSLLEEIVGDVDKELKSSEVRKFLKDNKIDIVKFDVEKGKQGEEEYRLITANAIKKTTPQKEETKQPDIKPEKGNTPVDNAEDDWEENYAELAAYYSNRTNELKKEIENSPRSEKGRLEKELEKIYKEDAALENEFIEKWNPETKKGEKKDEFEIEEPVKKAVEVLPNTVSSGFHTSWSKEFNGIDPSWGITVGRTLNNLEIKALEGTGLKYKVRQPVSRNADYFVTDIYLPDVKETEVEKATQVFDKLAENYQFLNFIPKEFAAKVAQAPVSDVKDKLKEINLVEFYNEVNRKNEELKKKVKKTGKTLTLKPSEAKEGAEIIKEVEKLNINPDVLKWSTVKTKGEDTISTGGSVRLQGKYRRPFIGKAEIKTLLANAKEFSDNPILIVDKNKDLTFESDNLSFRITAKAMQLSKDRLNVGDEIVVDKEALKSGKTQQMRVFDGGEAQALFAPKEKIESNGGVAGISKAQAMSAKAWGENLSLEEKTKDRINKTDIMTWVSDAFNVPIKSKVTHKWKAAGVYYPKNWLVRLGKWGELAVLSHETSHHIDNAIITPDRGKGWRRPNKAVTKELADLDYDQKQRRTNEGFAEYMRYWITTDQAQEKAPEFTKYFNEILKDHPDLAKKLNKFKEMVDTWNKQGAVNRFIQHMDWRGEHTETKGFRKKVSKIKRFINEKFNDEFYSADVITKEVEKTIGRKLRPSQNPIKLLEYSKAKSGAIARTLVMDKFINENGEIIGDSLVEALKPVKRDEMQQFIAYAVAKRAIVQEKKGKESGFDAGDAKYIYQTYKSKEWDEAVDNLTKWSNNLLDWLIRAGGLDGKSAKAIRDLNPFYIPFKRAFLDEVNVVRGVGGFVDTGTGIKTFKGSGRPIINPIESMIAQAGEIISKAQKLRIAKTFANLAGQEKLGGFIVRVPAPKRVTQFNANQIKKYIDKQVYQAIGDEAQMRGEEVGDVISTGEYDDLLTVFTQDFQYRGKENVVTIWINGKQMFYEIHPDLYQALKGVDPLKLGSVLKAFSSFASLLRLGATGLKIAFGLARNPFRDAFTYATFSKKKTATIFDPIKGLYNEVKMKEGDLTWRFKKLGGSLSGQIGYDRASLQSTYDELLNEKLGKKGKFLKVVKHPVNTLRDILSVTEMMPRSIEIENGYKKYISKEWREKHPDWTPEDAFIQAFNDAQDVTINFTKSGSWARQINHVAAFFNAQIRGVEKTYRSMKESPVQTTVKGILNLTLIALGLWWKNKDEDWYKNLPPAYKYSNLFFEIGDTVYRLPIPFEIGIIFMAAPQAMLDTYQHKDSKYIKSLLDLAKSQVPNPTPSMFTGAIDVATNKNYLGVPIESEGMQYLYPTERKRDYTTKTAIAMSKGLDKLGISLSPIQIDYLIDSYSGGFLKQFRVTGDQLEDYPVIGDLILRDKDYPKRQLNEYFSDYEYLKQKDQSGIATREEEKKLNKIDGFYSVYKDINKAIKKAEEAGDTEKVKRLYDLMIEKLEKYGYE